MYLVGRGWSSVLQVYLKPPQITLYQLHTCQEQLVGGRYASQLTDELAVGVFQTVALIHNDVLELGKPLEKLAISHDNLIRGADDGKLGRHAHTICVIVWLCGVYQSRILLLVNIRVKRRSRCRRLARSSLEPW